MKNLLATILCSFIATSAVSQEATLGQGGVLRGLDKVNGNLTDIELNNGENAEFGHLRVTLEECRFPTGNPSGDAWAYIDIRDSRDGEALFAGWMVASSPALNALDHPRYDVWVLRCRTEDASGASE